MYKLISNKNRQSFSFQLPIDYFAVFGFRYFARYTFSNSHSSGYDINEIDPKRTIDLEQC